MNYKYLLLVILKNHKTESYYGDSIEGLFEYAQFRKFVNYEIYELKKVIIGEENNVKSK